MRLPLSKTSDAGTHRGCSEVVLGAHLGVVARIWRFVLPNPTCCGFGMRGRLSPLRQCSGGGLIEVIMSVAISSLSVGGILQGYIMSSQRVEWLACSQAANSMAAQRIEQVRAAKWDLLAYPAIDEVVSTNFPSAVAPFDMPSVGNNQVYGTNVVTITTVSVNPPMKMISVECTWRAFNRGLFTNVITVYRSPDQ